jgi:hypothetical protein
MSAPPSGRAGLARRRLLGGLGAGAPLLASFLRHTSAFAQTAPAGNLLVFFTPNGHKRSLNVNGASTPCFDASGSGPSFTLGSSLAALAPFQADVAVIKGLTLKSPTFIASHQDICRILTCQNAPGGQSKETQQNQFTAFGPSIDHAIGISINQRPLVIAVDPYRDRPHWRTFLSWRAAGVNEPFVKNHQAVFADLFGALTGAPQTSDQVAALMRARARNQRVLDFIKGDIAAFRARIKSQDRAHLDAYLDALRSVEQKITQLPAASGTCSVDSLQPRLGALAAKPPVQSDDKSPNGVASELQARGEAWMDMIATAFACGRRRIAVMQWQGASEGYDPGANTGSPTHHSVSHYGFGAQSAQRWVAIDTWYAQRFAYLLKALKALGVLDSTVVVWVSAITEAHNQLNMVTVVAGGRALGFKLGQYIKYPWSGGEPEGSGSIAIAQDPRNRSLADLWATVQQAMGVRDATFGDPRFCAGPLAELRSA